MHNLRDIGKDLNPDTYQKLTRPVDGLLNEVQELSVDGKLTRVVHFLSTTPILDSLLKTFNFL